MKQILLSLLLAVITVTTFSQSDNITVNVESSNPGTGLITIQLTETGTAFSGTIVWDSVAGFPDRYQEFLARFYGITATRVPSIIYGDGVTDIDGNFYPTVIIGNQEWMAKNLRVTKYNNGYDIPMKPAADTSGSYVIYPHGTIDGLDSDAEVDAAYGKLYNWFAVDDERGLCPAGWSVPSDEDWSALVAYVVDQGFPNYNEDNGAANALKSCRQVNHPDGGDCDTSEHPRFNSSNIHSGFDKFGFSALPGGFSWGGIKYVGVNGSFWSSSEGSEMHTAGYRYIGSNRGDFDRGYFNKRSGFSVRCFREVDN